MEYCFTKLGFNKQAFVEEILNNDFQGDISSCAHTLGITPSYLKKLLFSSISGAGMDVLTKIHLYAQIAKKNDPYKYIFIRE